MKKKILIRDHRSLNNPKHGFTLIEMLISSSIMLIVILGTLSLYMRSNKVAVDQQQFAALQHDVRSGMFFIARDVRSAGVGLPVGIAGYFIEGKDAFGPTPEASDSIKVMGNFDDPLDLRIESYAGGIGGGAATAFLEDYSLENAPYPCPDFYENRTVLIVSTTCPNCFCFRYIGDNSVYGCGEGAEHFNMQPGQAKLNPPGGLVSGTNCSSGCTGADCFIGAIVTMGQIKQYWVDTTGNPGDYSSDFNLAVGQDGYLGIANTLYLSTMDEGGNLIHLPLAQNIESLQFQYVGDFDGDGDLDANDVKNWDNVNWTIEPDDDEVTKQTKLDIICQIRQVKIWVLGRTENPFVSVSGTPPPKLYLYRRPDVANSPKSDQDDKHRRFLLESTAMIRNVSLNLYNAGTR